MILFSLKVFTAVVMTIDMTCTILSHEVLDGRDVLAIAGKLAEVLSLRLFTLLYMMSVTELTPMFVVLDGLYLFAQAVAGLRAVAR